MSPRKSSTSSGKPSPRPRYLGIEVTGVHSFSPRWLEQVLSTRLEGAHVDRPKVRVIRHEGARAIVEVDHLLARDARDAWNGRIPALASGTVSVRTVRTWGTLAKGKVWIRSKRAS